MNFSEDWKSPWPISAVIAAPKLLTNPSTSVPPPLFSPSSPPTLLLSSRSLSLAITPPLPATTFRDTLHAFLSGGTEDDFVPISVQERLVSSLLPDHEVKDPVFANNLRALHCRDGSTFVLFFPTGKNADKVAFFGVSSKEEDGGRPELIGNCVGGVFKQLTGYRHSCHRITQIAVCPVNDHVEVSEDSVVEGYVLATTMYSVSWFRVEMRSLDPNFGRKTPFLVPMAKQGFKRCVVHACWNPYFVEESVVLLESGELFCINLETKRGNKVEVLNEGVSGGDWLSCEFGAQPWILIVASSKVVVMVDLRLKGDMKPNVLAKAGNHDCYSAVHSMKNDRFLAFCSAEFDRLYFSAVSEHLVFLYDVQQPLFPLLTWDHGISHPCYVSMFKLSEVRPSKDSSQASSSLHAILVGSFWNSKFKLFCYGPNVKEGASSSSSLYAWELPSSISLSGREYGLANCVLREEEFLNEELHHRADRHLKKELVLGFCIFPRNNLLFPPESNKVGGFDLIRLISSGKIEFQQYCASSDHFSKQPISSGVSKFLVSDNHSWDQEQEVSTKNYYVKFDFLLAYVNSKLSETLSNAMYKPQAACADEKRVELNPDIWELINNKIASTSHTIYDATSDASLPASIHEITSRKILASLSPTLLYLAFSTYPELFDDQGEFSLELFQVPCLLSKKHLPPFLVGKPSGRGERWSQKEPRGASLVGPVLPLPILLTLEQHWDDNKGCDGLKEASDEDLLVKQCSMVRNGVFPEISLAESSIFNVWDSSQELQNEKPFFIYEAGAHTFSDEPNAKQSNNWDIPNKLPSASNTTFEDENYTTFICGIRESYDPKPVQTSELEMFDDLMLVRLDLDSPDMRFSLGERIAYECLSRQFLKWQANYKPYQDFCTSSKVNKKVS